MPDWDPLMTTGVARMDEDHKALMEKLNELGQAMRRGRGRDSMGELLAFLEGYVKEHFGFEEQLMKASGYPGYEDHRQKHDAFRQGLAKRAEAFARTPDDHALIVEIHGWLMAWLRDHALYTDVKLGDYVRESD